MADYLGTASDSCRIRRPNTIADETCPELLDIDGIRKGSYLSESSVRNSRVDDIVSVLEEHCDSKQEHSCLENYEAVRKIAYRVPINSWVIEKIRLSGWEQQQYGLCPAGASVSFEYGEGRDQVTLKYDPDKDWVYRAVTRLRASSVGDEEQKSNIFHRPRTTVHKLVKVARYIEATIPDGACPVEYTCATRCATGRSVNPGARSSSNGAIVRRTVYDPVLKRMIDSGSYIGRQEAWRPATNFGNEYLLVDMGKNTGVTHVSIMGAPPPSKLFPSYDDYPNHGRVDGGRVRGLVRVLADSLPAAAADHHWCSAEAAYGDGSWVTIFELHGRINRGKWIKIGRYKGNYDPYTEVIRDIRADLGKVQFRYLKFTPVAHHGAIAMMIDVFGLATEVRKTNSAAKSHVTYTVELPIPLSSKKGQGGCLLVRDGKGMKAWRRRALRRYHRTINRRKRRKRAERARKYKTGQEE